MSSFGENLQFYRKRKNMTQEQLADQLEVSRQTVSKWEAGASFPEMEKILLLCDTFSCDMDTLMRKDASKIEVEDSKGYNNRMEKRRKQVTLGVVLLITGVAFYELLTGLSLSEAIADTLFMVVVIVAVLVFVVEGMQQETYRKKHPVIPEIYSKQEKERFDEKFPARMATGIGIILVGVLIAMNSEHFLMSFGKNIYYGMTEDFYYGIFMLFVAAGAGILVHTGLGREKYNISSYNKEDKTDETGKKIGIWCGCIMLVATMIFLVLGFCFNLWHISWVAYVVGGLMCGIVTLILEGQGKKED